MSEVPVSPNRGSGTEGEAETGPADLLRALIPGFALGATDADEAASVIREIGLYPDAAEELTVYGALAERLLYAAPPASPSPALAERLRATLVAAPAPRSPLTREAPIKKPARRWLWPVAAAAATLLLLAGVNFYLLQANTELRTDLELLQATAARQAALMTEQQGQLDAQSALLAEQDAVLAAMVTSEGERYTMNAAEEGSQALAEVAWIFDQNVAVLRASGFPPLEPGKVYQLWLIRNGERTSGGTFVVDEQGTGTFVFSPPESLDNFEGMGITPEPAGGSPGPTAPPVVRAQL